MAEWRLFEEGTVPEWTTPAWYAGRERAPHLEQELHKGRLALAADMVRWAVDRYALRSVVDLGAGDGGLLWSLRDLASSAGVELWGYDLQPSNVLSAHAERGADVRFGDVLDCDPAWAELAICTEFLEHLVSPEEFLRKVARSTSYLVASSPWTETASQHYEFHTWAWDQQGYADLARRSGFEILRHETVGMFQVLLCKSTDLQLGGMRDSDGIVHEPR